ncbi:hypothetical protein SY88_19735 [Clostridiales bacterium PH28_bin88]|nr:hypothetical protein SY88_19735 [Clostridiales bacterium PH28_bin88]
MQVKIQERYGKEAPNATACLSCGNNLPHAGLQPGEVLLDLGSGQGLEVLNAARLVGPTGFAYGVDMTPAMVEQAEANRREQGVSNAEFRLGEIEDLPFASSSVDVVISNCVINHAQDKGRVYSEIHRVLKPGGRFVVSDVIAKEALPDEVTSDPVAWSLCYGGAIPEDQYLDAISGAGFRRVEFLSRHEYLKYGYPVASITILGRKD